jgi:RNA polymerase subunit RPABC4/transcription elongation factor Spt4
MSTQICPVCREDSFTWYPDEEKSPLTVWACYNCEYTAYEDETLEGTCLVCNKKSEMLLKDEELEYWWCATCNTERPSPLSKI